MPCYASLACYADPTLVRVVVRRAIDAGFHVLKLHEADVSAIRAAREEAGPGVELTADMFLDRVPSRSARSRTPGSSAEISRAATVAAGEF